MKRICAILAVICIFLPNPADTQIRIDAARVKELASLLEAEPCGFGAPISNREVWNRIGREPSFEDVVERAVTFINEPVPELPDSLFLEFSRNGNRYNYQAPFGRRRSSLALMTIAECIENRGRFIPAIERYIRGICTEKTWVLPAHDRDLDNFYGRKVQIDLACATASWYLATADYMLGDRLDGPVRRLIRDEVRRRAFDPFLAMIRGEEELLWWMTEQTNNWNSVCIGGVAGAALTLIDSREERGLFLYGVEKYAPNYILSLTDDGYCSEGLGYWNYGFGHYIMLAEAVRQATGGQWDMLDNGKVRRIAEYPLNVEIAGDIYPAFADCSIEARPNPRYMRYLNRRYEWGIGEWETAPRSYGGSLYEFALYEVTDPYSNRLSIISGERSPKLRHWFEHAGILIVRPHGGAENCLAVALKGGHNGEQHNHNDVGSYVAVLGGKALLADPGGEVYTARTFSSQRYESNVLNSFGHPVPVIAGKLQKTGADAKAVVLETDFTESSDRLVLDLTTAYDVPELKRLTRTFEYSREGRGSLKITDNVEFFSPETYENAIVTFSSISQDANGTFVVREGDTALRIDIDSRGFRFTTKTEEITEDLPLKKYPTRTGFALEKPVRKATVTLSIRPADGN